MCFLHSIYLQVGEIPFPVNKIFTSGNPAKTTKSLPDSFHASIKKQELTKQFSGKSFIK
jgi:hypothetical protein